MQLLVTFGSFTGDLLWFNIIMFLNVHVFVWSKSKSKNHYKYGFVGYIYKDMTPTLK